MAFGAVNGGVFYFGRPLQVGVFVGIVSGLIIATPAVASSVAAGVSTLGLITMPAPALPFESLGPVELLMAPVAAGVVGWGVPVLGGLRPWVGRAAVAVALAMVIINLWATTIAWDAVSLDDPSLPNRFPSLVEQLRGADLGIRDDPSSYIATHQRMRQGMSFYDAFLISHREWKPGENPSEVWGFRQPHLYWFWAVLPWNGWGIILGLLVASTGALVGTYAFGAHIVKPPLALPAVAAVAAQMLHATTDRQVVMAESWAVCFILMAMGAYAMSQRTDGIKAHLWTVAMVWLVLTASLTRVLAVPLLIAGVLASLYAKRGILYLAPRILGLGVFIVAYGAHALAVVDVLSHGDTSLAPGGWSNVMSGLTFGTRFFGGASWLPLVLSLAGLVALYLIPDKELRLFVALPVTALVLSWFVYSNQAESVFTPGVIENYWGKLVVPALYACLPVLYVLVPGMARARPVVSSA